MSDHINNSGVQALGSRLRRMADYFTEQSAQVYQLFDVALEPKWFPVFRLLQDKGPMGITEIARYIGHSHASVSKISKELIKAGLCLSEKVDTDARLTQMRLSDKGLALSPGLDRQCEQVEAAVTDLISQASQDLWQTLDEYEHLLAERGLFQRIQDQYKQHSAQEIEIVDYHAKFAQCFKALNVDWIEQHFELEETDLKALDNPQSYVIDPGGYIFIALLKGEPIGTCALLKAETGRYELAKMAVTEQAKGRGIGFLLGQACLDKAREINASSVFLESNTKLGPALNLYQKLGFQHVTGASSPYQRCDVQMEIVF